MNLHLYLDYNSLDYTIRKYYRCNVCFVHTLNYNYPSLDRKFTYFHFNKKKSLLLVFHIPTCLTLLLFHSINRN